MAVCDNIGNTAAIGKIATGQGKIYTDNAKKIIRQIQNAENGLLLQRKELNERKMVELRVIFLSVIIFMLILLVVLIQKVNTDYKEKKKAAERLSKLNEALEDKVAARTKELSASKKTLEETFLRITDAFIALDKNWCYTYINKRAAEMLRMDANDLVGKNIWEAFPGAVNSSAYHAFHKAFEQQQFVLNEDYYQPLDLWQENHIYPSPEGISVYINDISEKKKAEEKIVKANRLYFFISQVNQMIVRTTTEEVLFKEACRIAVELGKFKMAWIGLIDEKTNSIVPVMYAGEESGYLSMIKTIVTGDVQEGRGPTGKAARRVSM
ncbi:MAG: PAS domain S-box protein [Chitinophagaceae bacterium]|nr:PAS domain S-box protein [Chitinophagaceae bacterium]